MHWPFELLLWPNWRESCLPRTGPSKQVLTWPRAPLAAWSPEISTSLSALSTQHWGRNARLKVKPGSPIRWPPCPLAVPFRNSSQIKFSPTHPMLKAPKLKQPQLLTTFLLWYLRRKSALTWEGAGEAPSPQEGTLKASLNGDCD